MQRLWRWFMSLFLKKSPGAWDAYHPGKRRIYSYYDGQVIVHADPLVLWKRYKAVSVDLASNYNLAFSVPTLAADPNLKGDTYTKIIKDLQEQSRKGHERYVTIVREVFSVKSLSEGGLTDDECDDLIDHFISYIIALKKNTRPTPTMPRATSPISPLPISEGPNPVTKPTSGSGSIEIGGDTSSPDPSSMEPDGPTDGPIPPSTTGKP